MQFRHHDIRQIHHMLSCLAGNYFLHYMLHNCVSSYQIYPCARQSFTFLLVCQFCYCKCSQVFAGGGSLVERAQETTQVPRTNTGDKLFMLDLLLPWQPCHTPSLFALLGIISAENKHICIFPSSCNFWLQEHQPFEPIKAQNLKILQFDWMVRLSLLQSEVTRTSKRKVLYFPWQVCTCEIMCAMCTRLVTVYKPQVHLLSRVTNVKTEKICSRLFWTFGKNYPRKNFNVYSNCSPTLLWPMGWQELSHTLETIASWCNKFTRPKPVNWQIAINGSLIVLAVRNTISSLPNDSSRTWPGYEAMFQSTFSDFF